MYSVTQPHTQKALRELCALYHGLIHEHKQGCIIHAYCFDPMFV